MRVVCASSSAPWRELCGREDGAPPPVALNRERRAGEFVREAIDKRMIDACHDVSDGGILVAVAEMGMASGIGAKIEVPYNTHAHAWAFGEDQGRYIVTATPDQIAALVEMAREFDTPIRVIGETVPDLLVVEESVIAISDLKKFNEHWLPAYMAGTAS